ncbi:CREB-regulated transcription coactivator 2 [Trichomycterus rosablanca]|uniref:CREB-regulated transcription coactivator 2 n=1 Tax=Trichomycterus rosablanca TaxID=2290929 RepID=UPI002F35176A
MNLTGAGGGAAGRAQWPGTLASSFTCNPRKFSEKIALHTQRQAEDIAAFREVMMDITSTRIHAQRVRQVRNLASYYGGSLPNVNQISACSTETQSQILYHPDYSSTTQQHVKTDQGQRDHRPNSHGRPNRRHIDSAPYLSSHMSPPSGPGWRRNWSSRSVNEKKQMDQLPVPTLSRTHSDSALHTSVRMTYIGDPSSAHVLNTCSRKSGSTSFPYPVPLIEENVLEEGRPYKLQKTPSMLSECDTPGNNISGSLPDLSSLCLPSTVPEIFNSEPLSHSSSPSNSTSIQQKSNNVTLSAAMAKSGFSLPGLSTPTPQVVTVNPLLQASLSNPNLKTTHSRHSLCNSLSSTSLCPSLSSSSLKSSLSSQSLQSSYSSSSLGNQSVQSTASTCSYSSGIGGSCSCSSSSLSCSPHACGQVTVPHSASSRRRTPLSPLMMPCGEESLWQLPKQFSPTVSSSLSPIAQGVPLDTSKVPQEVKPLMYPYNQLPLTETQIGNHLSQSWPHDHSLEWHQYSQDTRQQSHRQVLKQPMSQSNSQLYFMQHQHPHCKAQLVNPHHYATQQQMGQQTQNMRYPYQQSQSNQHQPLMCPPNQYPPQHHTQTMQQQQQYPQIDRCLNPQLQLLSNNQHQLQHQLNNDDLQRQQPLHEPNVTAALDEDISWQNHSQNVINMEMLKHSGTCMNTNELSKPQSKKPVSESGRERTAHYSKAIQSQKDRRQLTLMASLSSVDNGSGLLNESYNGLELTPSQTEALSQKLGQLYKLTTISNSKCQDIEEKNLRDLQTHSSEELCFPSTSSTLPSTCLDEEILNLPFSVPEIDLESFALTE